MPADLDGVARRLRRAVIVVAVLNLVAGLVEVVIAITTNSVSLFADAVDFGEDFAVNTLVALALTFMRPDDYVRRARAGVVMAVVITLPAVAALLEIIHKAVRHTPPEAEPLMLTAAGALVVNAVCAVILSRFRAGHGSLATGAWLAARNDVAINAAIIVAGALTWWLLHHVPRYAMWPDFLLGLMIMAINVGAAKEVLEVAQQERLADKALAGEDLEG